MGRNNGSTGITIFVIAWFLLTVMLLPVTALLKATKGTVWYKFVIMGLIGSSYFVYMDIARVNKCDLQRPYRGCPYRLSDYVPHDW